MASKAKVTAYVVVIAAAVAGAVAFIKKLVEAHAQDRLNSGKSR